METVTINFTREEFNTVRRALRVAIGETDAEENFSGADVDIADRLLYGRPPVAGKLE